jgi:cell division protein FtsW
MTSDRWGDRVMLTLTLVLLGIGATTVFTASSVIAMEESGSAYTYLISHCVKIVAGLVLLAVAWAVPLRRWGRVSPLMAILALLALVMVLLPTPLRVSVNGVNRWLRLGPVLFQPSELAKVCLVMYLAWILSKKGEKVRDLFKGYLPPLLALVVTTGLIAAEPSLGCAAAVLMIGFLILFAAGSRLVHLFATVGAALPALVFVAYVKHYQWTRITTFFASDPDPLQHGWQVSQSKVALGSGGLTGRWGDSLQKFHYLPDPHTDFIFSVLGEQWGFIGAMVVLGLLTALLWRGARAAVAAQDPFARTLAIGLTGSVAIYTVLNVAVATGSIPTTGLPFPFLSYGGSALASNLFSVGLLLNVSRFSSAQSSERVSVQQRPRRRARR